MGTLYIVSTPIGNLEDMSFRAVRILSEVDAILAEDTRTIANLLKHFKIPHKPPFSFFEGNENEKQEQVLRMLRDGANIALVSESGTPLISDPGFKLVREAVNAGIKVESIPGATALITALTTSGLPTNAFLFLGFLPKKESHAKDMLEKTKETLRNMEQLKTVIIYEGPHRVVKTLQLIEQVFGDIEVVVARELTKMHEEVRREFVSVAIAHFTNVLPRGEFVIMFSAD